MTAEYRARMARYRRGHGPVIVKAADGTRYEVKKRRDGWWGWTEYRSGNAVGTAGQRNYRCRALAAAVRMAGPGAKQVNAVEDSRGRLTPA